MNSITPRDAHVALPTCDVIAFIADEELRDVVARAMEVALTSDQIILGGIEKAIEAIARETEPHTLIVDLAGIADPLAALDRLSEVCVEGTRVIAIGDVNDIHFYRTLRSAGITEYLHRPLSQALLTAALVPPPPPPVTEAASPAQPATAGLGPIAVIGARGGVGATMVAASLAWIAAETERQRTVLVDLDLVAGSTGLALDLEGGRGLADALATPDRIDGLLVASASVKHGKYLSLLSSEPNFESRRVYADDAVKRLIAGLRQNFQRTVIDVPRTKSTLIRQAFEQAASVVIVTDFSLAGIRDTARFIGYAQKFAPGAKCLVAGNRLGLVKKGALSVAEVEKAIGVKFAVTIPEDDLHVPQALNVGKPVPEASPGSPAMPALTALAAAAGILQGRPKSGLVLRLVGAMKSRLGKS